ncbi:MAG: hypothetical protein H6822_30325 [Planctomycetaceae bacterium]|nr:hypothetical protein [Planctomycetales bacterium]MCB9926480.1 hypothetical protein [Planctomycetaceae bacterium]
MSRKPNDDDGSLELLLDTICNTFGGVLFISILVVLLLNLSSNEAASTPPNESDQADLIEAETRLAQSNDELDKLLTAIEAQQQIEQQIVDPEIRDQVQKLRELQQENAEQTRRKLQGLTDVAERQKEINDAAQQIKDHEETLRDAQQRLAEAERELQQEIESRSKAAKLPKGRATTKTEIPMFLRAGRLCTYVRDTGNGLAVNQAEIDEKQDEQNRPYIEPKPGTGIVISLEGNDADLDTRLSEFDYTIHYLAVFVWPDSFEHFAVLKDRMVSHEFEYRLEPFREDQKIYFGTNEEPVVVQ